MIAQNNIENRGFSSVLSKIISHLVTVAELIEDENKSNGGPKGHRFGMAAGVIQEAVKDLNTINQALYPEIEPSPIDDADRPI